MVNEVRITITADDRSQEALQRVQESLRGVEDNSDRAQGAFRGLSRATTQMAGSLESGFQIMTRLDLVQITLQQSTERVTQAQRRLSDATAEFGAGSREAIAAAAELEQAQVALEKANLRAELSFGLVVLQGVQMAAQLPQMVAALNAARIAGSTAAVAMGAFNIALTGGVAAVAIVGGIAALSAAMNGLEVDTRAASGSWRDLESDLAEAEARFASLRAQVENPPPSTILGPGAQRRRELREAAEEAAELRRDALRERVEAADEFASAQQRRALIEAGDVEKVTAALREQVRIRDEATRLLATPLPFLQREEQNRALKEAEGFIRDLNGRLDDLASESRRAADESAKAAQDVRNAWEASLDAMSGGLQSLGVDLRNLGERDLRLLSQSGSDAFRALVQAQLGLIGSEKELVRTILDSGNPALVDQIQVTARKGETTGELARRLGLTSDEEARLTQEGRLTTDGLISQAEAMRRVQVAAAGLQSSLSGGPSGFVGQGTLSPALLPPVTRVQQGVNQLTGRALNPQGLAVLDAYYDRLREDPSLRAAPGVADLEAQLVSIATSQQGTGFGLGSTLIQNTLRSMGIGGSIIRAANGFEGIVRGPQLFLAGEAGPERVSITPRGGGGLSVGNVNVTINGSANAGDVRRGVMSALDEFTRGPQERLATRRAY